MAAEERLEDIRKQRLEKRQSLIDAGIPAYPAEARRTHTLQEVRQHYDQLKTDSAALSLIGRITSIRGHGGVLFLDIRDTTDSFQLQVAKDSISSEFFERLDTLDTGDFIQAAGELTETKRGTPTLQVHEFHILAKSIRPLPSSWFGLKDLETRFRQREVDLLMNEEVSHLLHMRTRIISWLRHYLTEQGYLEVETPILQPIPGGAAATPFETHHKALDMPLYLRIAPELYLKRLLVGGFEKVFEIGRSFRNEGIDRSHNPEFTICELYWAYADYEDLMDFTEDLFATLVASLFESEAVEWGNITLEFRKPITRVRYVDLMKEQFGVDVLTDKDPSTYLSLLEKEGKKVPEVRSYAKLVDELYKGIVRPHIIQPTMVCDYPIEMAPLAKANAGDSRIAEQFQFLAGGMELVKAYTELNDPVIQRQRFEEQERAREAGDEEAQRIDEAYLRALEYGMPPAAGWGLGIDRLVAILTNAKTLRDTIAFPLLKPER